MSFYDYSAINMNGTEVNMSDYKDKVVLIVNTASSWGFTPQFKQLEQLYKNFKDKGLEILGFPCNQFGNQDSGSNSEIAHFCTSNFDVTFNMFEKIEVNGDNAHPLYKFLKNEQKGLLGSNIKWNFTKFLVAKDGTVIKRYAPTVNPTDIVKDILANL